MRIMPVTWGYEAVVVAEVSCFSHHLQLASHGLVQVWQKVAILEILN